MSCVKRRLSHPLMIGATASCVIFALLWLCTYLPKSFARRLFPPPAKVSSIAGVRVTTGLRHSRFITCIRGRVVFLSQVALPAAPPNSDVTNCGIILFPHGSASCDPDAAFQDQSDCAFGYYAYRFHSLINSRPVFKYQCVAVPLWLPTLMTLIPPLTVCRRWLVRLGRRRRGLCPDCGYDLRATPDHCPECGAVPECAR